MKSKKFINEVDTTVQESLNGLALMLNNQIDLIETNDKIPIVSVKKEFLLKKQVKLVCGGGSGHEPAHAGFVCPQMLSTAVCGRVFASPSLQQVKSTLEYMIQAQNQQDILVIIKNYTGDIINFEAAVQMIQNKYPEDVKIKTLHVGDDITFDNNPQILPRGIAGTVILYKILGAASSQGYNLDSIYELGQQVLNHTYSLGVCLESCTLPGQEKNASIKDDQMEVGLGIHGEKGQKTVPINKSYQIVEEILIKLTQKLKNKEIAVFINNLGCVSPLEMGIVINDVQKFFQTKSFKVLRIGSGQYMTSCDMNGVSITIIENLLTLKQILHFEIMLQNLKLITLRHKKLKKLFRLILLKTISKILVNLDKGLKYYLVNLQNKKIGDGDMGSGLAQASKEILKLIDFLDLENNINESFQRISDTFSNVFGGTSGPLWGVFISELGKQLPKKYCETKFEHYKNGIIQGTKQIMKIGGAKKEDRTIVDILLAIQYYLEKQTEQSIDFKELVNIAKDANVFVSNMLPKLGRSQYLGEKAIGQLDPGCQLVYFTLQLIQDHF